MRSRTKTLTTLAASAAVVAMLAGCSAGGGDAEAEADGPIIVYTNSNGDGKGEWITEQAAEAGIEIEIVGLGGGELANRIIAEQANPVGDVVFGLNEMYFESLQAEEAIAPYTPSWSGEVPADSVDAEEAYWPLVEQAIVGVYDANRITGPAASFDDLYTDEAYAGRYEANQFLTAATPQVVVAGILAPYLDESGDLGVSDEGWAAIEAYYANGSATIDGTDFYSRFERGEVDYGTIATSNIPVRDAEFGTQTQVLVGAEGAPYITEQIGVIAGAAHEEGAQEFADWFGSADVQGAFAAEFNSVPVNEGALEQANQDVVAALAEVPRQDIDWAVVGEHMGSWVEKIELEYL